MQLPQPSNMRQQLRAGSTMIGAMLPIDAPMLVEMCGLAGFDFVFLDTEHGSITPAAYEGLIRAADLVGLPSIVRVARDQAIEVGRALDAGAQGIHVPFVETVAQAQAIAQAARFAPSGQRGLGPVRANRYGTEALPTFVQRATAETLVTVAIESPAAVGAIPEIGQVPGIDVLFIAPADLSAMLGYPGQFDHPDVQAQIELAITLARATGLVVGSLATSPHHARQLAAQGVQYILMVLTGVIMQGARGWLEQARAAG